MTVLSSGPADLWLLHIGRYHDGLHVQSLAPEDEDQDQSSRPTDLQLRGRNENTAFVLSNSECSSCIVPRTYIQLVSWSSHYSNAVCLYRLRELHISGRETLDTGNSCKRSQQQVSKQISYFPGPRRMVEEDSLLSPCSAAHRIINTYLGIVSLQRCDSPQRPLLLPYLRDFSVPTRR